MGQRKTPRDNKITDDQTLIAFSKEKKIEEVTVTPGLERKEGQRGRYMTERFQHALQTFEPKNTKPFFKKCRTEPSFRKKAMQHSIFIDINIDKAHTLIKYFKGLCYQYDPRELNSKIDIIRSLSELIKKNGKDKTTMHSTIRSLLDIIRDVDIQLTDFATSRNVATILFTPVRYLLTPIEKTNLILKKLYSNPSAFQKRRFETLCRRNQTSSNQYLYSLATNCPESKNIILKKLGDLLSPEYRDAISELHSTTNDNGPRKQVAERRP